MSEDLTFAEYALVLREDFTTFVARCFCDLNPQAKLAMNWHLEVIAAKLMQVREGKIRRLIINLPPRHLKSLMASIAFPAWCLRHDPSAQILCVSYAQDLADKFARDREFRSARALRRDRAHHPVVVSRAGAGEDFV